MAFEIVEIGIINDILRTKLLYTRNSCRMPHERLSPLNSNVSGMWFCLELEYTHTALIMKGRSAVHILHFIKVCILQYYTYIYECLNCHSSILNALRSEDTMENYYNAQVFINRRKS